MAGLYIHIPFCKQACHYCDFHFSTNLNQQQELVMAIAEELYIQKGYLKNEELKTIYLGGGTPSLLSSEDLRSLFHSLYDNFRVDEHAEITLEANPDDLSTLKLNQFRESGINRLSIGIQSFDNNILQFLNRAHDSVAATHCVEGARRAGFVNISIDLIYAIPGQDNEAWIKNIKKALALNPEHISCYTLTVEPKTAFGRWAAQGKLKIVDDEVAADQLEILVCELEKAGYEHYEVSNFSKPGYHSSHNSNYWKREPYLGVGPSAHSYNGISRQFNVANNALYLRALKQGKIPFELEVLTRENQINEYLLTTLRTTWGCNLGILQNDFDYTVLKIHAAYLEELQTKNLAVLEDSVLKLTKTGKLLADKIASDLFC